MAEPVEAVLIGAGGRGHGAFGAFAQRYPYLLKFTAVAEPDDERRARFAQEHNIPAKRCFRTWEDMLAQPQLAPALINTSMDRMHVASTLAAIKAGYHILLEKPMAVTPQDCVRLVRSAEQAGRILAIGHVLRYAPLFSTVHDIVQSGRLGDVVTVEHKENVAFWHMAHSFVRGNWGNLERSAPMLLAKCCHDMDILVWILGRRCKRISSFGSLTQFRADRVGPEIPARCTDGCPKEPECPYSAMRQYLGTNTGWPVSAIAVDLSYESRLKALQEGPYGRCVFRCDNDVVDHQVVNMEFEGGLTVAFTMHGHSHENVRTMRYSGTRATLRAREGGEEITLHEYATGREDRIIPGNTAGGHGGGDAGLIGDFVRAVREPSGHSVRTSSRESLQSHLIAFAAEESRLLGKTVDMEEYCARMEAEVARER